MNVKLRVLSAGVLFFMGGQMLAQKTNQKKDTATNVKDIEEVVVVGYTKKNKDVVTSAVSSIKSETLERFSPITTVANILQGKSPGVDITAYSGKPGSGANINIRGLGNVTTTSGASSPLIVIDGNVVGNNDTAQFLLNSIPPGDIEDITILKDAASAAIYGSQGANGVIVVTTKNGKGKTTVFYSAQFGFSEKIKDINFTMMNAAEKIAYEQKVAALGTVAGYYSWPDQQEINDALSQDHDWQRDILRRSFIESHNLGIRGGNDKSNYSLILTYDNDNGIVQYLNAFRRYSGRFKYNGQVNEKLDFGVGVGASYRRTQDPRDRNNVQNPFRAMYGYNSYEPVYNPDGSFNNTFQGFPILEALKNNPEYNSDVIIDANIFAQYKILPYLAYKIQGSGVFDANTYDYRIFRGSVLDQILGIGGQASKTLENSFNYTFTNLLTFSKTFGEVHNVEATALAEYVNFKLDRLNAVGRNFSSPSLSEVSNTSTPFSATGFSRGRRLFGYGILASYDYMKKYIVTGSARRDADSRFGANNVWSDVFWSASVAWNITRENFLKDNSYINNFKLRASWGTRGYNNIPLFINQPLVSGGAYGGLNTPNNFTTLSPSTTQGNPDLKWEVTKSQNYGAEFSILKNRISGTVDYFIDSKKDFILSIPNVGDSGGGYATSINAGDMRNRGWEFSLNGDVIKTSDLNWSLRANISLLDYKLNKLRGDLESQRVVGTINMLKEGEEPFIFYLVRSAGVNPLNGNEQYYDINGNITENYSPADQVALSGKSPLPKGYGGFGTTFRYKNFDINADFNFKYGNYIYNYMALNMLNSNNGANNNLRTDAIDFWTPENPNANLPKPGAAPNGLTGLQTSDRFLQDGSYIRFRNLTIGYTFDRKFLGENNPLKKLRLSITGQNLATWTKFEGDPEVSIGSAESQTGAGQTFISGAFALYSYPQVKTFLFGIDVEF